MDLGCGGLDIFISGAYWLSLSFLPKQRSPIFWAAVSGGFGLCFGFLYSIPYFVAGGWAAGFSYWISGIPFDLIHCAGNAVLALVLFKPLLYLLKKLKREQDIEDAIHLRKAHS